MRRMTANQLLRWLQHMGLTKTKGAAMLGISRSTLYDYLGKKTEIPLTVELACSALMLGVRKYPPEGSPPGLAVVEPPEPPKPQRRASDLGMHLG